MLTANPNILASFSSEYLHKLASLWVAGVQTGIIFVTLNLKKENQSQSAIKSVV